MKKLFIILIMLFLLGSMTACNEKKALKINSVADIKVIELQDGNTGEVLLVDSAKVRKAIAGFFTSNDFFKEKSSIDSTGWSFRLKFFDVNNKIISDIIVMSPNEIAFDNSLYVADSDNAIDISYIKELISAKNIDVDMFVKNGTLSPSGATIFLLIIQIMNMSTVNILN